MSRNSSSFLAQPSLIVSTVGMQAMASSHGVVRIDTRRVAQKNMPECFGKEEL